MLADEKTVRRQPHFLFVTLAAIGALALIAVVLLVGVGVLVATQFSHVGVPSSGAYLPSGGKEKIVAGIHFDAEVTTDLADEVLAMLDEARQDHRVAGVLLDVNSPGGSVVASQEIYDAIVDLRETLPVVVYVREMAASGAYYASAAASKIVVNRGSMLGSVGVILSSMETSELLKWAKLKPMTLKTGALKDAGSPTREWTSEDKAYLQKLINDTREQFVADVKATRQISDDVVKHLSDGRVVLGTEAVEMKLADALGTKQDAVDDVAELAGVKETLELVYMERPQTFQDSVRQFFGEESMAQELRKMLGEALEHVGSGSAVPRRR